MIIAESKYTRAAIIFLAYERFGSSAESNTDTQFSSEKASSEYITELFLEWEFASGDFIANVIFSFFISNSQW